MFYVSCFTLMIWVDRVAQKIKERQLPLEWVDDMKTPSGRVHVGALRGVVIHDLLYKALIDQGITAKFTYVFDDQDPMDGLPSYLDPKKWGQYMGLQLYKIPSPEKGYASFAQYYAQEFIKVFSSINCHPEIIWASELYKSGKMNGVIKEILDNIPVVKKIYERTYEKKLAPDWFPFSVVCENCEKIGTTKTYKWDGEKVHYRCEETMVTWAKGCRHEGSLSPFDGNGKLNWKVEWAAKWKVIGVTVEGAGKDHMSAGGAHDIASEVARKVLQYQVPYAFSYEWLNMGGKSMSSSKGIGASAKEVSRILPPEVLRFFIVRSPVERALDFNPYGDTIPNLFDEYDRCLNAYFDKLDHKLPDGKQGEVLADFARIIELSQVRPLPDKRLFLPRFRTVTNLVKTNTELLSFFENQKGSVLTDEEKAILEEREEYSQVYLKEYEAKVKTQEVKKVILSGKQKVFLKSVAFALQDENFKGADQIQARLYDIMKAENLSPREAFVALYSTILGRPHGPKVGVLLFEEKNKDLASLEAILRKAAE